MQRYNKGLPNVNSLPKFIFEDGPGFLLGLHSKPFHDPSPVWFECFFVQHLSVLIGKKPISRNHRSPSRAVLIGLNLDHFNSVLGVDKFFDSLAVHLVYHRIALLVEYLISLAQLFGFVNGEFILPHFDESIKTDHCHLGGIEKIVHNQNLFWLNEKNLVNG